MHVAYYYYYSPFQEETQDRLKDIVLAPKRAVSAVKATRIPAPVAIGIFAGAAFFAYAPLLQPGPPAKRAEPGILPIYNIGGFAV
jgi:hypothetical protein